MNTSVYREFSIKKTIDNLLLKGTVGVTANIDYDEIETEDGKIKYKVKFNHFNGISFYQMVLYKSDEDGEFDLTGYRKDILSIEDKNIKKIRDEVEKAIKNKFKRIFKLDQMDLLPF